MNRSYEVLIAKPHRRNLLVDQYRGVVLGEYKATLNRSSFTAVCLIVARSVRWVNRWSELLCFVLWLYSFREWYSVAQEVASRKAKFADTLWAGSACADV